MNRNGHLNRVQERQETMLKPKQDNMILKKLEKKSKIQLINEKLSNDTPFEILAIGPGRWEFGKFIEAQHKAGDKVFIVGNIAELKYNDTVHVFGRERDIIAEAV